jgi:ESS family glutamate:Na+ symporter
MLAGAGTSLQRWAVNLALTGLAVAIGWLLLQLLRAVVLPRGGGLALVVETLPVFPLALLGSLLMRWLVERCGADQLVSGPIQNRVGSVSADLLIAAATACLDLSLLAHDWLPLLVLSTAGLAWNLAILLLLAPRMLPPPWFSRGIIEFGQATGVAASGLLLLNMADPEDRGDALTPFSIKQLLIQPLLAGGVITVVAPLAVVSWGLGAWTALSLAVVLLAGGTGLWLARGNNAAQKPPAAPGQNA